MCKNNCESARWYCESIRDKWRRKCKRCDQWQQGEVQMFKSITILILAVILLLVVCNTTFDYNRIHFGLPSQSSGDKIEQRLMSAARLIEEAKHDEVLKGKVDKVLENWDSE